MRFLRRGWAIRLTVTLAALLVAAACSNTNGDATPDVTLPSAVASVQVDAAKCPNLMIGIQVDPDPKSADYNQITKENGLGVYDKMVGGLELATMRLRDFTSGSGPVWKLRVQAMPGVLVVGIVLNQGNKLTLQPDSPAREFVMPLGVDEVRYYSYDPNTPPGKDLYPEELALFAGCKGVVSPSTSPAPTTLTA